MEGDAERSFDRTGTVFVVAWGESGWTGTYVRVDVGEKDQIAGEPTTWSPRREFFSLMQEGPSRTWRSAGHAARPDVEYVGRLIAARMWGAPTAAATMSVTPSVIFTDQQSSLTWNVANATGATKGMSAHTTNLVPGGISGTKYDGAKWGAGGTPICGAPMSGTFQISGQAYGHCRQHHSVHACTLPALPSAAADAWLDILGLPQFKGNATAGRKADIRTALTTLDNVLRGGAIVNDTGLDSSVDAFKTGRVNRKYFWGRLMAELENLNLDAFVCTDVTDANWGGGHWADYTNDIILDWSPSYAPYLEYVIAHELIHKCGFNSTLLQWYSTSQVELMAHAVSASVFP